MISRGSTGFEPKTNPAERRDFFDLRRLIRSKTSWAGGYDPNQTLYDYNDIVVDDGWTMVCTEPNGCTDRPAPQPTGDPFNIYQGTSPTSAQLAKQILFGNRYTFGQGGYLTGWRIFTEVGNHYIVYSVTDPDGTNEIRELLSFTGSGGWEAFGLSNIVVTAGTVFELLAIVQEPDQTPTTFSGNWNYQTPPNPATPIAGQIIHANSTPSVIAVSTTDADLNDRTADLQGIEVGDTINGPNASWAIQTINELPTFFEFGVAPAVQDAPDGLHEFVFETVTPTPITYLEDVGYWATSPHTVQGVFGVDGATPVFSDNAYGTDIEVQAATVSDQWEALAFTDGLSGGGSQTWDPGYARWYTNAQHDYGTTPYGSLTPAHSASWTNPNGYPVRLTVEYQGFIYASGDTVIYAGIGFTGDASDVHATRTRQSLPGHGWSNLWYTGTRGSASCEVPGGGTVTWDLQISESVLTTNHYGQYLDVWASCIPAGPFG